MKHSHELLKKCGAIAFVLALCLCVASCSTKSIPVAAPPAGTDYDGLTYQGQVILTSKPYDDYDSYKDDPNNLPTSELPKIEKLVRGASVPTGPTDNQSLSEALMDVNSGYGMMAGGTHDEPDGSSIELFSFEIPQRNRDRYVCYRGVGGSYTLIDDFVLDETDGMPVRAHIDHGRIEYENVAGKVVLTRTQTPGAEMTMGQTHLYRIILPVPDIERAAAFYGDVFGNPGERVSPGRHYFDCGGTILACYDPGADGDGGEETWSFHPSQYLYFAVADLDAALDRVKAAAGTIDQEIETMPWGERLFYARDPFGSRICFVDETTLFVGNQSPRRR